MTTFIDIDENIIELLETSFYFRTHYIKTEVHINIRLPAK